MTGYTQPDNLPYPNDYQEDADVPLNMQSLANAVQTALEKKMPDTAVVIAGNGLIGGGGVELNPTLNVGVGTGIIVGADNILLDRTYTDSLYVGKAITISAGTGLTGGGTLAANRSLALDTNYTDNRYAKVTISAYPPGNPKIGDIWVPV